MEMMCIRDAWCAKAAGTRELSKRGIFYIIRETECHATYTTTGNTPPWHNTCHGTAPFSEEQQSSAQAAHPPWRAHACSISGSARICACAWVKAYVFLCCGSWPRPFPTSCWNSVVDMSKVPRGRPLGPKQGSPRGSKGEPLFVPNALVTHCAEPTWSQPTRSKKRAENGIRIAVYGCALA